MSIRLGRGALDAIRLEAARAYPHEACGALLGSSQAHVSEALALPNQETARAGARFTIAPADYLGAEQAADTGTFAFESGVKNQIRGIGQEVLDLASQYGSGGRLASVVLMDTLTKYPSDPLARVNGENTSMSLVGHETGHRWGATLQFRDGGGTNDAWLGRQRAHWSFFADSDASVLEGNEIQDQGGSFRTLTPVQRYSPFDLYSMGVLRESEVPSTFYIESAVVTDPASPSFDRESAPRSAVSINGARRDVTISQVVAAMGARSPAAGSGPFEHRQAWIYVTSAGRPADPAAISKLDGFRRAFESFFASATGGRMSVVTPLD